MPAPEDLSREELIGLVAERDARIAAQDTQITTLSAQVSDLVEANERLVAKLARLEHLLSRNSGNSSMPPSKDDDPGRTPPEMPKRRAGGTKRRRGKQPGAPGANLAWVDNPTKRVDRFPQGHCACGHELAGATDLDVVDRYQQHEIPELSVTVTQYDQHQVRCGCGEITPRRVPRVPAPGRWGTAPTCRPSPST
ncbi:DUF6444 domain-containing protein [Pseudonocardia nigra]|uniref:DUF6444 domain-containing protein n=1 Tax=Pseudonocardia nigra TaxID=1921578 RepID=UPI001C5FC646|nr:DUF6444 domain-containing protein [Pseudonocardia nigra]